MCGIVLCIKADRRASEADNAVGDADKTYKRAKDLKSKIGNESITFIGSLTLSLFLPLSCCVLNFFLSPYSVFCSIYNWFTSFYDFLIWWYCQSFNINCIRVWLCLLEDLLKELQNQDKRDDVPADNVLLYENAKRMVKEMEDKNFTPELTAAKKESDEAKKCMTDSVKPFKIPEAPDYNTCFLNTETV